MAVTAMTVFVVAAVQATAIPIFLSLFKEEYSLRTVVLCSIVSGVLYLVPDIGGTLSFLSMLGLLYWHLRPDNVFTDVFLPVATARLCCVPVLMLVQ
jgi:predicted PurR-regulated permease PerM